MALGCKAGRPEESGSRINRAMKLSSEHCTFVPSLGRVEQSTEEDRKEKKDFRKRFNFRRGNNSSVGDTLIYTNRWIQQSSYRSTATHTLNKTLMLFLFFCFCSSHSSGVKKKKNMALIGVSI